MIANGIQFIVSMLHDILLCYRSKHGNGQKSNKNIQKFVYDDGFIACHADLDLVIGIVSDSEGQKMDVSLVKRKRDEISQMWLFKPNG